MDARSDENKGCVVPGWAPKSESRKVILVSALRAIDEAPERTQGSQHLICSTTTQPPAPLSTDFYTTVWMDSLKPLKPCD